MTTIKQSTIICHLSSFTIWFNDRSMCKNVEKKNVATKRRGKQKKKLTRAETRRQTPKNQLADVSGLILIWNFSNFSSRLGLNQWNMISCLFSNCLQMFRTCSVDFFISPSTQFNCIPYNVCSSASTRWCCMHTRQKEWKKVIFYFWALLKNNRRFVFWTLQSTLLNLYYDKYLHCIFKLKNGLEHKNINLGKQETDFACEWIKKSRLLTKQKLTKKENKTHTHSQKKELHENDAANIITSHTADS